MADSVAVIMSVVCTRLDDTAKLRPFSSKLNSLPVRTLSVINPSILDVGCGIIVLYSPIGVIISTRGRNKSAEFFYMARLRVFVLG